MKKILISFTILLALVVGITLSTESTAICWDCPPKKCMFDTDCGVMCYCHIGKYDITGVCVSK